MATIISGPSLDEIEGGGYRTRTRLVRSRRAPVRRKRICVENPSKDDSKVALFVKMGPEKSIEVSEITERCEAEARKESSGLKEVMTVRGAERVQPKYEFDESSDDESSGTWHNVSSASDTPNEEQQQVTKATFADSSDDEATSTCSATPEAPQVQYAGLPSDRFFLPPDPSRQPSVALVSLQQFDELNLSGFNSRVLIISGTIYYSGGKYKSGEWLQTWGGEGIISSISVESGESEAECMNCPPEHPLLSQAPSEAEYKWALVKARGLESVATVLVVASGRSSLMNYLYSFHPSPKQVMIGSILEKCRTANDEPTITYPSNVSEVLKGSHTTPPRIILLGSSNTGKSTLAKYITNVLLDSYQSVDFLDTDMGQADFSPPGCVSLTRVTKPVSGPSYCCQSLGFQQSVRFLSGTSPQKNPLVYVETIISLLAGDRDQSSPLVINTHGWVSGIGLRCLSEVIQTSSPTHAFLTGNLQGRGDTQLERAQQLFLPENGIIRCLGGRYKGMLPSFFSNQPTPAASKPAVVIDLSQVLQNDLAGKQKTASWQRQAATVVSLVPRNFNQWCLSRKIQWEGHSLIRDFFASQIPYEVPLQRVTFHVSNIDWTPNLVDSVVPEVLFQLLDKKIVALYRGGKDKVDESGVSISSSPPGNESTFVSLGVVVAVSSEALFLSAPCNPLTLRFVTHICGSMECPSSWFDSPTITAGTVGRTVLHDREGGQKKTKFA